MIKRKNKNNLPAIVISLVAVAVLVVGGMAKAEYSLLDRIADRAGDVFGLKLAEKVDVGELNKLSDNLSFGAMVSPWHTGPDLSVGGVRTYSRSLPFNTASTTLCLVQSPAASSTLEYFSVYVKTASTTALTLDASHVLTGGQGTATANHTHRFFTNLALDAAVTDIIWTVTPTTTPIASVMHFGANQFIKVMVNPNQGTDDLAPTGKCKAVFKVVDD